MVHPPAMTLSGLWWDGKNKDPAFLSKTGTCRRTGIKGLSLSAFPFRGSNNHQGRLLRHAVQHDPVPQGPDPSSAKRRIHESLSPVWPSVLDNVYRFHISRCGNSCSKLIRCVRSYLCRPPANILFRNYIE